MHQIFPIFYGSSSILVLQLFRCIIIVHFKFVLSSFLHIRVGSVVYLNLLISINGFSSVYFYLIFYFPFSFICSQAVCPPVSLTNCMIKTEAVAICDQFLHFLSARTLPKNVSVNALWKFKLIILYSGRLSKNSNSNTKRGAFLSSTSGCTSVLLPIRTIFIR